MSFFSRSTVGTIFVGTIITGIVISACKFKGSKENKDSRLKYLTNGGTDSCTLRFAREPAVRICIYGGAAGGNTLQKAKDNSKRALLTWFRALRQIDDKVTSEVLFSCEKPHLKVQLEPGSGTSMGRCGYALIYSQRPYGSYLHEFGHAVAGLADTYYGGSAGSCVSGQPQSVMCWGAYGPDDEAGYNRLFPDDVKGIQSQYRRIVKEMQPPQGTINPFAPLDPEAPWAENSVVSAQAESETTSRGGP